MNILDIMLWSKAQMYAFLISNKNIAYYFQF